MQGDPKIQAKPILKAMLICDHTIVEEGTHKRTLIGLFDRIRATQFPTAHPAMSVYVQFREVEGVFDFTLELVDLTSETVVSRSVIKNFKVQDKSRDCEMVFNLFALKFEHPGDYEFRIYMNDLIFGQKSFSALK